VKNKFVFLILLLPFIFACGVNNTPTPTIPTESSLPTLLPTDPSSENSFEISELNQSSNEPAYTITAQIPSLSDSNGPHINEFNLLLNQTVMDAVNQFTNDVRALPSPSPVSTASFFNSQFSVIGQQGGFWSVKFNVSTYYAGAAHPGDYSITMNYDLEKGNEISLEDLFIPGSNYLEAISEYCKAELATRDIAFDSSSTGADPLPENYTRWNVSVDGLVITFDEYQVAPYAAGPQVVVIPFNELMPIVNQDGALALFAQ